MVGSEEYTASIQHAPIPLADQIKAYPLIALWIQKHLRRMFKDLLIAADQVLYNWQNRRAAYRAGGVNALESEPEA